MNTQTANALLLFVGLIWGAGFAAQQSAMADIGPLLFVSLRFFLAGLIAIPLMRHELHAEGRHRRDVPVRRFVALGAIFCLALSIQQVGLLGTTVTNAGFLTTLYAVIVPVISFLFLGERLPLLIWPAALASPCGVFLLSAGGFSRLTWGDKLILIGAIVWAIHAILVGRLAKATGLPFTMACIQFLSCGLFGLIAHAVAWGAGWEASFIDPSTVVLAGPEILYAGLISGCLAFTIQAVAQRYTTPSMAVILMSTESLFAAVVGAILMGDSLPATGYFGGGLMVCSVIAVQLVAIRADQKTPAAQDGSLESKESVS